MKAPRLAAILLLFGCFDLVNLTHAQTWIKTSAKGNNWTFVGASIDGIGCVAINANDNYVYTSTNFGATWVSNAAPFGPVLIGSSALGTKLIGAGYDGPLYISTNSGTSWIQTDSPSNLWLSVASSTDWTKLIAVSLNGANGISLSTNSGLNWTQAAVALEYGYWQAAASSADGSKLVAVTYNGGIYTSTNSGNTWATTSAPSNNWGAVAVSSDGNKMAAVVENFPIGGPIYISQNSGTDWIKTGAPIANWDSIASSADGTRLAATVVNGPIYTSTDSGMTWVSNSAPVGRWFSVVSSVDGHKLMASDNNDNGGIWTLETTPSPVVNIMPAYDQLTLSWTVPSANFVLQANSDLTTTNWVTLTNAPTLNLTNLQDQVWLSPSNTSGFYRLSAP